MANPFLFDGAGGRNRTDMELPPRDFESRASTSFTTPAWVIYYPNFIPVVNKIESAGILSSSHGKSLGRSFRKIRANPNFSTTLRIVLWDV